MNNNPLTNQSYINKDFQTIYPELLDLVKSLTYKWDPTVSNESDPGVLLIKLNAIIADKNNYNIDKNILECFPDTVTQYDNAFKLFNQLGYTMRWYKSAMGTISLAWNSDPLYVNDSKLYTYRVKVPQFTMVCDNDKEIVYTTLQDVFVDTDGELAEVPAIQGVIRDFTIGSRTIINPSMLDYRNRLYFPIRNVAENGVFISNATKNKAGVYEFVWDNPNTTYSNGWKRVETLSTQAPRTKCYKFGIDQSNSTCYIEFPDDITDIMGEGIQIKYIQSDGSVGNVAAGRITKFYEDLKATSGDLEIDVSTNTKVTNYSSITNGLEPEEIAEAYGNYQKTVGTFDTLVTLRDYLNYIVNEEFEEVSNGFVTDRTNDIQSSYDIITKVPDNEYVSIETVVAEDDGIPQMTAYDLKTYLLEYSQWPKFTATTDVATQKSKFKEAYDKSFTLKLDNEDPLNTSKSIKNIFNDTKTISHNFISKLPHKILMIKNKFDLSLTIIPNDSLSQAQADDIEKTLYETVLKSLHSKNINFGEEISYEMVYDICNNADPRVKAVALDNIEYKPYAVVYIPKYDEVTMGAEFDNATDYYNSFNIENENGTPMNVKAGLNEVFIPNSITKSDINNLTFNDRLALEICAKNILKGVTPLYHQDKSFEYSFDQTNITHYNDVERISTYNAIEFNSTNSEIYENKPIYMNNSDADGTNSKMLDNETLFLYAPSLREVMSYETTIKYVYFTENTYTGVDGDYIPANRDYVLQEGQHLFMFWKEEDSDDAPYVYHRYGKGTILNATTKLIKYKDKDASIYNAIVSRLRAVDYTGEGQIFGELNDELKSLTGTILSTNKKVTIKEVVSKELTDTNNYCYWITNDVVGDDYRITFNYVPESSITIDRSYQAGQVYLANFNWKHESSDETKKLVGDEKIIILDPINERVSYNARNASSGQLYVNDIEVTSYRIVEKLGAGDTIDCTGNIYSCIPTNNGVPTDDTLFKTFVNVAAGTTVPWGYLSNQTTADTLLNSAFTTMTFSNGAKTLADGGWLPLDYIGNTYRIRYFKDEQKNISLGWYLEKLDANNNYSIVSHGNGNYKLIYSTTSAGYEFRADISGTPLVLTAFPTTWEFKEGDYFKFTLPVDVNDKTYIEFFTTKSIGDGSYKIPVANNLCSTIGENPQWVLSNGYKIDVVTTNATPEFGNNAQGFSTFEYILKSGEYFIYAFDGQKGFEMLENGTKITITLPNSSISPTRVDGGNPLPISYNVHKIDYNSIQEQGIDAFTNSLWKNFTCSNYQKTDNTITSLSGTLVTITENQIMSLGAGTKIRVMRVGKDIPQWSEEKGFYKVTTYDDRFANLKIDSTGIYASKSSVSPEWKPYRNALDNYTVQYVAPDDTTNSWVDLPSGLGELNWNGYTILNIKSGFGVPQVLNRDHKQKVTLYGKDGNINTLDSTAEYNGVCIQSNVSMNLPGGNSVDVTRINADNETMYLNIIAYKLNPIEALEGVEKIEGGHKLTFDERLNQPLTSKYITFGDADNLLGIPQNTLLPIEFNEGFEVNSFNVYITTDSDNTYRPINPVNGPVVVNGSINKKIYYYEILHNDSPDKNPHICTSIRFMVDYGNATNYTPITATIKPLIKYNLTLEDTLEDDKKVTVGLIKSKLNDLDIDGNYNYTYEPKEDNVIYNPLTAKNYFNTNHKYNKFTIPQISKTTIKVMNKR